MSQVSLSLFSSFFRFWCEFTKMSCLYAQCGGGGDKCQNQRNVFFTQKEIKNKN